MPAYIKQSAQRLVWIQLSLLIGIKYTYWSTLTLNWRLKAFWWWWLTHHETLFFRYSDLEKENSNIKPQLQGQRLWEGIYGWVDSLKNMWNYWLTQCNKISYYWARQVAFMVSVYRPTFISASIKQSPLY